MTGGGCLGSCNRSDVATQVLVVVVLKVFDAAVGLAIEILIVGLILVSIVVAVY